MFKRKKRRRSAPKQYIDDIPIYTRIDRRTGESVKVAYFDIWCQQQIGVKWTEQYGFMLETMRVSLMEIEDYWMGLREDFYRWCTENGLKGWGVHMYNDK